MTTINIDWLRNEISEAEKKVGFNSTSLMQKINESRLLTLKSVLEMCKEIKPKIKRKGIIDLGWLEYFIEEREIVNLAIGGELEDSIEILKLIHSKTIEL
jgi:hypothetical protein